MRILLVTEFLAASGSPTGALASDFVHYAASNEGTEIRLLTAPGPYTPGGLGARRLRNLFLINLQLFFLAAWNRVSATFRGQAFSILVTTTPPMVQWTAFIVGALLRVPVVLWLQDAHPELEARLLKSRGLPRLAEVLRFADKQMMRLCKAVVTLDEAMRIDLQQRTQYRGTIAVVTPWATYIEPPRPFRAPSSPHNLTLLYAGNYGAAHDLSPFAKKLASLNTEQQRFFKLIFVGMPASSQNSLRQLFAGLACELTMLPRFPSVNDLKAKFRDCDFGVVSLHREHAGICCPSKAYSYISQGLPIFYIGPEKTLSAELCQLGWGCTLDEWFGPTKTQALQRIQGRAGSIFPNPRDAARAEIFAVLREN